MLNRVTVLVVALVLVVGGGLFAVFFGRVRETANRVNCTNNLKRVGLALHEYQDSQAHFPAGTVSAPHLSPLKRLSWVVEIWPVYMQGGISTLFDRNVPWDEAPNQPPTCVVRDNDDDSNPHWGKRPVPRLRLFECSSNPNDLSGNLHYVGIAGIGLDAATLPKEAPSAGVFGYEGAAALKDIKDPANNLLLAETALNNGPWTAGGSPTVRGLNPSRPYIGHGNQFGGTHPGGVNVLFADGSVRFLDEAMDPKLLERMATIAGEEIRDNNAP